MSISAPFRRALILLGWYSHQLGYSDVGEPVGCMSRPESVVCVLVSEYRPSREVFGLWWLWRSAGTASSATNCVRNLEIHPRLLSKSLLAVEFDVGGLWKMTLIDQASRIQECLDGNVIWNLKDMLIVLIDHGVDFSSSWCTKLASRNYSDSES